MSVIQESIGMLGLRASDKVSGLEGVITSVCFDLYGCVQVALTPPAKDGESKSGHWYDVNRLTVDTQGDRVMKVPDFDSLASTPGELEAGPSEKLPLERHV